MKKILLSVIAISAMLSVGYGQLTLNTMGTPETIDFTGFDASGFEATPVPGQLDSDTWEILGFSDGDVLFGGSSSGLNDLQRGTSTGGVSTGGVYAFDDGTGNVFMGFQSAGGDFTPGSFILKVENNTGSTIADLDVSYDVKELNNEGRSISFNLSHSADNNTYTNEASVDYASVETAAGSPTWVSTTRNITLSGVNIAAGDVYYINWTSDDVSGSGSRDEMGIDNISITGQAGTPTPIINVSPSTLSGFTYVEGAGPSTEQSFTVNGSNLTDDITITAPANYEISTTSGSGFTNTIDLTQSGGSVSTTDIYVRLAAGLTAVGSPYNQTITVSSAGATSQDVDVEGSVTIAPTPLITATPTSITGFAYVEGSGPSAEQSFTVEGSNLTDDITLTAPTNYEISETSGSGFSGSITLTQSSGSVAQTTIFVRLQAGLLGANSPFNETIVASSTNALDVNIDCEGTVTVTTNVSVSETQLTGFSYMQSTGGPSSFQSFNVGGTGLSGDITITAPTNYEISATSGSGYTNSIDLTPATGTVSPTTIYVRLKGSLVAANSPFNEDVTVSSSGVSDQMVALEGEVIDDVGLDGNEAVSLSIFPNPFKTQLNIVSEWNTFNVSIADVLGKVVYSDQMIGQQKMINLDVPSGVYFITISKEGQSITKKLIKQ